MEASFNGWISILCTVYFAAPLPSLSHVHCGRCKLRTNNFFFTGYESYTYGRLIYLFSFKYYRSVHFGFSIWSNTCYVKCEASLWCMRVFIISCEWCLWYQIISPGGKAFQSKMCEDYFYNDSLWRSFSQLFINSTILALRVYSHMAFCFPGSNWPNTNH